MFTPQQLDEVSFDTAVFNGYDKEAVDEFLEPLIEDYVTLYKENALLKSKMRVLVEKLEEYRRNEASIRDAMAGTQRTCDQMVRDAEAKCTQMLNDANLAAAESAKNATTLIAAENQRVEEAKKAAGAKITEIQDQMKTCIQALERIKTANLPTAPKADSDPDSVADEISKTLVALVGTADEPAPKAAPRHPQSETTSKFINLQFGRNYDPTK